MARGDGDRPGRHGRPLTSRFHLPAEHAAVLTRAAAADNLAVFAQYIAVLGAVEDDVVACFERGGDVPYPRSTFTGMDLSLEAIEFARRAASERGYTISCMHCMTVSLAQGGEGVGAM